MKKNNLIEITYMRSIACLLVVLCHASIPITKHYPYGIFTPNSKIWSTLAFTGVGVFFIISGFLMSYIHGNDFNKNKSLEFLKKRLFRIAPMYYIATTATIIGFIYNPNWFPTVSVSMSGVMLSLLFIPSYYSEELHRLSAILGVGWTLCFEAFFYVIFAMALKLNKKLGLAFISTIILGVVATGIIATPEEDTYLSFFSSPIIVLFITGVFFGVYYERIPRIRNTIAIIFTCLISMALYFTENIWIGIILVNLFFVFMLSLKLKRLNRMISIIGIASYSIYLFHRLFIGAIDVIIGKFLTINNIYSSVAYYMFLIITSICIGIVIYRVIESRINNNIKMFRM
ncbi:acyltransferase family protein [Klebsiella pneumoniae]